MPVAAPGRASFGLVPEIHDSGNSICSDKTIFHSLHGRRNPAGPHALLVPDELEDGPVIPGFSLWIPGCLVSKHGKYLTVPGVSFAYG